MPIIEAKNISKEYRINEKKEGLSGAFLNLIHPKYKKNLAVDNISFSIDEGEIVGYIGANGAGKSTTIKMLSGILTPTSGQVSVNGIIPQKNRIKNNMIIGAVFGQRSQLWWDIAVIESYKLLQKIYEIPINVYKENLDKFIELLDLKNLLHTPVRQLSLGQKMRCELAAAFLHNPKIVYLDEPTIGLDIIAKDKIRHFIKEINAKKQTTIILTTHDLSDIEELCNRIIIIDNGKKVFDNSTQELKKQFGEKRLIQFKTKEIPNELFRLLKQEDSIYSTNQNFNKLSIEFNKNKTTAIELINFVSQYCQIVDVSVREPSVESIVKTLYRK